jgi:hypothetical protein
MKGGDFLRKNGVPEFGNGSKAVRLRPSKCFQVCASKQTQGVYEYLAVSTRFGSS